MTLEQALEVAQGCADQSGVDQAIAHDNNGEYFVFTCPQDIDDSIDAVVAPDWHIPSI